MRVVRSFIERKSTTTDLALVALVAVILLAGGPYVYPPLTEATVYCFKLPFHSLRSGMSDLYRARERNHELQEALMQAMVKVNLLQGQKEENQRLRQQLGFDSPVNYRLIPLEALSLEYRGVPVAIQVNKGHAQGVKVGQPVINQHGLVGRIDEVSARYARVQLLTDPGCRVAGRVSQSREQGIIRYLPSEGLILDNLPIDGQVKNGDLVISSGLGGVFPEGLPVAVVQSVRRDETKIFADVAVKATVNFNAIDEIYALVVQEPIEDSR